MAIFLNHCKLLSSMWHNWDQEGSGVINDCSLESHFFIIGKQFIREIRETSTVAIKHIENLLYIKIICFLSELKQKPKIHFPKSYQNHNNSLKIELFFDSSFILWHKNSSIVLEEFKTSI